MNIIDAWKKANGKEIRLKGGELLATHVGGRIGHESLALFIRSCEFLPEASWLSDDWEVVKEEHREMWTMKALTYNGGPCGLFPWRKYPEDAKVTIEWED